ISLLLLLFACLILLSTWGYYKFYKNDAGPVTQSVSKKQTDVNSYRESLQKIYTSTIDNINTKLNTTLENTDSLHLNSNLSAAELYKLKAEIVTILNDHPLKAGLEIARQKIFELQTKLGELQNKNVSVVDENKRLNGKLNQLTAKIKSAEKIIKTEEPGAKILAKKNSPSSAITISQLRLSALMDNDGKERETNKAEQTDKLAGSFTVKNIFSQEGNETEIFVVVLKPDGHVMQGSAWESGAFQTRNGRMIYSSKLHYENTQGEESKHLSFSLTSDSYQKGEYTIQLYSDGMIVGKLSKTLF
ncbi:MAG: hypothetical protein ABIQ07_03080, partial [Ginsengibacter sp.]